jgi:myo-inositol-1(or 4)-monophosphatase
MENCLPDPAAPDWLGVCRRSAERLYALLRERPGAPELAVETGVVGGGGDATLVVDQLAEEIVFSELETVHSLGHRFTVVSEELGEVSFGGGDLRVVIDPVDGSLNAARGLPPYALSFAVASGQTMADVDFAFVYDLASGDEWLARRGGGALLNGQRLEPRPERLMPDGRLEVLSIESASPMLISTVAQELRQVSRRIRALGCCSLALCSVAAARVDGMVTLWRCRAFDVAAAQLIVRESGGHVCFPGSGGADLLGTPLDLSPHHPVCAARSAESLSRLTVIPVSEE